jgi:two-component system sensor histidine kinase BaeS
VTVAGDAAGLRRAVGNLLENARRYTPPGGEVGVSVFEHEAVATIEVRDSGIGIPAADLPHVFERFYRGDSARSRDTGGCGLGLSIVKAIVEAHGGRVSAESAFGEGSVFTIRMMTVPFP